MSIIEKVFDKIEKERSDTYLKDDAILEDNSDKSTDVVSKIHDDYKGKEKRSRRISINFENLKQYGFLTPNTINATLTEQYRRIKMPILLNAFGKDNSELINRNLVMVTSAVQEEGKSFTSFNLALSIANEFNHTALYVDSDIVKQSTTKLLGLEDKVGLVDYLTDSSLDLSDVLFKTNLPNLTILPSGKSCENTSELFYSERMRELLMDLTGRYNNRLIIFDSPPLLQEASSCILAKMVGQIILVIEAEKTPQDIVLEALQAISDTQYIGLVLNKSNQRQNAKYGYYTYSNVDVRKKSTK